MSELASIMETRPDRVRLVVVIYSPDGVADEWTRSSLCERVSRLPDVAVIHDRGEVERKRFDARTSGQIAVYTSNGRLAYSGGITRARGCSGSNPGREAVETLLDGRPAYRTTAPVYGCPLIADATEGP